MTCARRCSEPQLAEILSPRQLRHERWRVFIKAPRPIGFFNPTILRARPLWLANAAPLAYQPLQLRKLFLSISRFVVRDRYRRQNQRRSESQSPHTIFPIAGTKLGRGI